jgi:hypothetical protein
MTPSAPLWCTRTIGNRQFQLLNLDHPGIADPIMGDMEAGIRVYYDRRWAATESFCHFLLAEPQWVTDKRVLILGAGVGLETLVIGSLCAKLYINDLAPGALQLCARQLHQNGIKNFDCLPGRYEHLTLPPVDLVVGCFLVYNRETAVAMRQLLEGCTLPVLLTNDNMPVFRKLIRDTSRAVHSLLPHGDHPCLWLTYAGETDTQA